jgi:hypothetical protein
VEAPYVVGLTTVETVLAAPSSAVRSRSGVALAVGLAVILGPWASTPLGESDTVVIMVLGSAAGDRLHPRRTEKRETASLGTGQLSASEPWREATSPPGI